jgi:hypothetical protein
MKTGDKVTCKVNDVLIKDAKIEVLDEKHFRLHHKEEDFHGGHREMFPGYDHVWGFSRVGNGFNEGVSDLKVISRFEKYKKRFQESI